MSPAPRPWSSDLLWGALLAVALHAFVRTHAAGAETLDVFLWYAAAGAVLQPGTRFLPRRGRRLLAPLLGALLVGALAPAAFGLDALGAALGGLWWADGPLLALGLLLALLRGGGAGRLGVLARVEGLKLRRGVGVLGSLLVALALTLFVGMGHDPAPGETGWTTAERSLKAGLLAAEALLLVLGAAAIAAEAAQGTLKMVLPHAYRRGEWVAAKALVLGALALAFAALLGATAYLYADWAHGLGDVVKPPDELFGMDERVHRTAETMRGHYLAALGAGAAALVASALTGLFVSCLFVGVVPSLSAAFLAFATVHLGQTLLGFGAELEQRLFAEYPQRMLKAMGNIGKGLDEAWDPALLSTGLGLCAALSALALLSGMRLFARRDWT